MGKFSRSWELVKQSFAVLKSDKQLMLFPILSAISCIIITMIIGTGGVFISLPSRAAALALGERWVPSQAPFFYPILFALYAANYFVIVFFNVALVGVANSRLGGGTWTMRDGLELAWARKGTILQWALVSATVGVILKTIEKRLGIIGRIVLRIIGIAWALACYFVVPVLAFEDLTPFEAIKRSSKLFKDTWGERVSGAFSFRLVFFLLGLPAYGLLFLCIILAIGAHSGGILLLGFALMIIYFVTLAAVSSSVQGIFNAALYRYACFKQVPAAFSADLITQAWTPKA